MRPTPPARVAVFGCGGFGREVAWLARSDPQRRSEPSCFVDDGSAEDDERRIDGLPVLALERFAARHPDVPLVVAVGRPDARRAIAERIAAHGLPVATLVHDRVRLDASVGIGPGSIVCEGTILTVGIAIGRHVHVNLDCTVGHDVTIGDFVTLSPGVHVSGNVTIEAGAFVGTGATIVNGRPGAPLVIGADAVVGAGAVVTADTEPGGLYVGVPARLARSAREGR